MTRNLWRDALLALGLAAGIVQALGLSPLVDGLIYWQADLGALYPTTFVAGDPAYVYPPPMAQAIAVLHPIGFGAYQLGLTLALTACLWWLAGRWAWAFVAAGAVTIVAPGVPVLEDLAMVAGYALNGNVQLFLAAAVVAAFRYPAAWFAPILTKPTMGVGVLWFLFRREWRPAAVALGATSAIAGASFVLAPDLWVEFVRFSLANSTMPSAIPVVPVPLAARVAMSVALLAWAAPRGHRWAVPIAAGWAIPMLYVGTYLCVWAGVLRVSPGLRSLGRRIVAGAAAGNLSQRPHPGPDLGRVIPDAG